MTFTAPQIIDVVIDLFELYVPQHYPQLLYFRVLQK